jgi:hypothetical protein
MCTWRPPCETPIAASAAAESRTPHSSRSGLRQRGSRGGSAAARDGRTLGLLTHAAPVRSPWAHRPRGAPRGKQARRDLGTVGPDDGKPGVVHARSSKRERRRECVVSECLSRHDAADQEITGPGKGWSCGQAGGAGCWDHSTSVGMPLGGGTRTPGKLLPNIGGDAECLATAGGRLRAHCTR